MNLENISKIKETKKLTALLFGMIMAGSSVVYLPSCSKKCGECPSGQYLVVDNPKEKQCYCCPDSTNYDASTGMCN